MQLLLLLLLLGVSATAAQFRKDCELAKNVTDIVNMAHHEYAVLEDCLYYKLAQKADLSQGKTQALKTLPPTKYGRQTDRVKMAVYKTSVQQLWMNEVWKEMHITGYMFVAWHDHRMMWKEDEWKVDKINIKEYGHLWMPDLYSTKYESSSQSSDFSSYKSIVAHKDGNISATLQFRVQAHCKVDYTNFPSDKQTCCFNQQSMLYADLIRYNLSPSKGHVSLEDLQSNWIVDEVSLQKRTLDEEPETEQLRLCLTVGRRSSTLSIELTMPMLVSAVLVVVAPLFGTFTEQLHVKLFSVLLQFMCFQFLVNKTPHVGFGEHVPKIYKFYEFTVAMTLVSIILTLLVLALSRIQRALPPPHSSHLFATTFNTRVCCVMERRRASNANTMETGAQNTAVMTATKGDVDYSLEWHEIHVALNNLLSLLVTLAYLLGVLIIWAM